MWAEGPGEDFQKHGHYINMSSTQYTMVACGFYETSEGEFWSVQNFK
ncbi:MAG: CAP domain-containing protein [Deltaproteobacteria bacterium]|nr:CAP domain-containing protein [Deltaproteobacteria bacterium]